jgi:uncharacterized membrane protein
MLRALKWIGTTAAIAGALMIALKLPLSGWGFVLFLVSCLAWGTAALIMRERSLALMQAAFIAVNLLGIYRWLLS